MSFFKRLFNQRNLSHDWIADPRLQFHVDLNDGRFCGVPVGAPVTDLAGLGPSDNYRERGGDKVFVYGRHGFQLFLSDDNRIDMVDINLVGEPGMARFAGAWTLRGRPVVVDAASTPELIELRLGPPVERAQGGAAALRYRRPAADIWFEWSPGGQLENVSLNVLYDTP